MLVIQASMMGKGGEIFILQMGSPIKIIEIAKDLIALHGLRPETDISIERVGLKAGEKMHEDLITDSEQVEESSHDYILTTHPSLPATWDRDEILARLEDLARNGDGAAIRSYLGSIIPDAALHT